MYARIVSMKLKAGAVNEFTHTFEDKVIPVLRKQNGFRDEISLVASERSEVIATSFWDKQENAEEYNRTTYQGVLNSLSKVLEGTPEVRTFEVSYSTFRKTEAGQAA